MVSINAIQHKSSNSSINSKQKQHVTEKKKKTTTTTVELKTSKQQQQQKQQQTHCTKTVIHEQAQAAGDNKNKNVSSKPRRSRLHRAWRWGWKRARRAFRAACCCCQASSTSSACCRRRKNCFPYVRRDCDEEDDIDGAFERYKRQMAQLSGDGIGSTSGGDAEYDELSPSQRNTIKKLHGKSKFWNWNDSVRSTSDRFLECLELDDISCGEASLRKKFTATVVARRKQITAFYGGGREDDRTILDEIEIGSVGGGGEGVTCGILLLLLLHGTL